MSLLNVLLLGDRALIAVDTNGKDSIDGSEHEFSKLVPIVHADAIVAGRGQKRFLLDFFATFFDVMGPMNFDEANDAATPRIDQLFELLVKQYLVSGVDVEGAEVVVVGWSDRDACFAGYQYIKAGRDRPFVVTKMGSGHIAPEPGEDLSDRTVADHFEYLYEIANAQVRSSRRDQPHQPIGGRLLTAEIRRGSLRIASRLLD